MKVEVLGTGCFKCIKLETLINEVLQELGRADVQLIRKSDEKEILKRMPLDEIPGLVIDGQLVSTNQVPDRATLLEWLKAGKLAT